MPILAVVCGAMGDKLAPIGGTGTVLIGVAIAASSAMILPISTPPMQVESEPMLTVTFKATATREKLVELREYMKQEGIKYE